MFKESFFALEVGGYEWIVRGVVRVIMRPFRSIAGERKNERVNGLFMFMFNSEASTKYVQTRLNSLPSSNSSLHLLSYSLSLPRSLPLAPLVPSSIKRV